MDNRWEDEAALWNIDEKSWRMSTKDLRELETSTIFAQNNDQNKAAVEICKIKTEIVARKKNAKWGELNDISWGFREKFGAVIDLFNFV